MKQDPTTLSKIDSDWLRRFRRNLRRWHHRHGRELPWRNVGDPYRVWISEIMLQQTTVAAVGPYFERFLARFPSLSELASAPEDEVLRQWEGLGYYSRARNIHKTARLLAERGDGRFPGDVAELVKLPGVGRYTAGAIASFAFDRPAPIVEANTLRLYCRLLGFDGDPRSAAGQRLLWDFAARVVPRKSPGQFNQALMDLGATHCTPSEPACPKCPVRTCCRAFAAGRQSSIPRPAARPEITDVVEVAVAVHRRGTYLLRRIPAGRRWAGLWDFVRFPLNGNAGVNGSSPTTKRLPPRVGRQVSTQLGLETGLDAQLGPALTEIRHSVTRYRIRLLCFTAECEAGDPRGSLPHRWVRPLKFGKYPLSVTGRKLADLLAARQSDHKADEPE